MFFPPNISPVELALIVVLAAFSAIAGGIAGYGTGALMAAPVVPIIAISAMFTNAARIVSFRHWLDWRRALIALVAAAPTCVIGAWIYTLLTGRGAALVIGSSLILTVPLRRVLKSRGFHLGEKGFAAGAAGWGMLMGASNGAGVVLLSILLASGLEGAAVIATDSVVSIIIGGVKLGVFVIGGAVTPVVLVIGLLIGGIGFPSTFLARLIVEKLPVHIHTAMLDAVVMIGGAMMIYGALRP